MRNEIAKEVKKPNRYNQTRHGNNEDTSNPSPKKGCFVDKTNRTIQENSDSYKNKSNTKKGACNESSSSE